MEEQPAGGPVAQCATCNEPLPDTARFCTYCGATTPRFASPPPGPSPSARRARRRRWRRAIGALVFVGIAVAVLAIAYTALPGSDDKSADNAASHRPVFATTTPPIPPAGPFKVTQGVNVRSGPGTSFPSIATIDLGKEVMVVCVIDGEPVNSAAGPDTKWVRVTATGVSGYVTSLYVATGSAIANPAVIPVCREI